MINKKQIYWFSLLQLNILSQKNMDSDMLEILHNMIYKVGKKTRTRKI
jgi:hypothetical protein